MRLWFTGELIYIYGTWRGIGAITGSSDVTVFNNVANLGINNLYFNQSVGTYVGSENNYIHASFAMYGLNTTVNFRGISYANLKDEIDWNRPYYLALISNNIYGSHAVVGYAYSRFVSTTTGWYKSFVKIEDGWNTSGRYIDIATISDSNAYMSTITLN